MTLLWGVGFLGGKIKCSDMKGERGIMEPKGLSGCGMEGRGKGGRVRGITNTKST